MSQEWTTIKPKNRLLDFKLNELWQYRDLILVFVKRDFKTMYKQTILGPLWIVISPILTTLIQVLVFGNIAQMSTDGMPQFVFYMAGNTMWLYFANSLNKTANTFIGNAAVFGKVYFPRLVTPISITLSGLITFAVQFTLFLGVTVYYFIRGQVHPNIYVLLLPILLLQLAMLGMGFGIIISALTTKYRDLSMLLTFGVQLWMYASAVIFPISSVSGRWANILMLNPVVPVIEAFRYAFTGSGTLDFTYLGISMVVTVVVLFVGIVIFNKVEKTFMDTV